MTDTKSNPDTEAEAIYVINRYNSRLGREYDTVVTFDIEDRTVAVEELPRDIRTFRTFHGRAYELDRRRGANWANVDSLLALLQSEQAQELLHLVADSHSVHWDGSNHVGRLTPDGACALEQLERLIEPVWEHLPGIWTAQEWFHYDKPELTGTETDEDLVELARAEIKTALPEHHLDEDDLVEYLRELRQEAQEAREAQDGAQ